MLQSRYCNTLKKWYLRYAANQFHFESSTMWCWFSINILNFFLIKRNSTGSSAGGIFPWIGKYLFFFHSVRRSKISFNWRKGKRKKCRRGIRTSNLSDAKRTRLHCYIQGMEMLWSKYVWLRIRRVSISASLEYYKIVSHIYAWL